MEQNPVFVLILFHNNDIDVSCKDEISKHLYHLKMKGLIEVWEKDLVLAGGRPDDELHEEISKADIVLFLVSPESMSSEKIWNIELKNVLEREQKGNLILIPIIVRIYAWEETALGTFKPLPKDGSPLKGSPSKKQDDLFLQVKTGIQEHIKQINHKKRYNNKQIEILHPDFQEIETIFQKSPDTRVMKHRNFNDYEGAPLCTAHFMIYKVILQEIRERLESREYNFYLGNIEDARKAEDVLNDILKRAKLQEVDFHQLKEASKLMKEKARSLKLTLISPEFDIPENWHIAKGEHIMPFCKALREFEENLDKLAVQSVNKEDFLKKFSSN